MKESLTKKYGPLPAWAWGVIGLAVLYGGYRWYKNRSSGNTSSVDGIAGQAPKSNLGTSSSGGGGGFSFPDPLPNTVVGESAQYTQPDSSPDTSAPAVAPLASAPITQTGVDTNTDPIDYDAVAAAIRNTPAGQSQPVPENVDWGQLDQALGIPSVIDIQNQLQAYGDAIPNPVTATPPPPTPTTQKVLPQPVNTLPANRATIGKAVAV